MPPVAEHNFVPAWMASHGTYQNWLHVAACEGDVLLQPFELGVLECVRVSVCPLTRDDVLRIELPRRKRALVLFQPVTQLSQLALCGQHLAAELEHLTRPSARRCARHKGRELRRWRAPCVGG